MILDSTPVRIGDRTMLGPNVQIYTATHNVEPEIRREGLEFALPITIGGDVWIGGGAIIGPGVTIGDEVTIGAGSVVVRDVPPRTVVAGNPARVVRHPAVPVAARRLTGAVAGVAEYDLVIFDNDGVLVDSERLANTVLAGLLTEHGMPCTLADSVRDFLGGTLARVHATYQERTGRTLPADFDTRYYAEVFAGFRAGLEPVPGVVAALDALRDAGMDCCVASSGTHERIRLAHEHAGLDNRFAGRVFSADDVAHGKPAPDLFLHAAASLGVPPRRCAVIEDSPLGVTAAVAAGMTVYGFAAVTPAERLAGAHVVFNDMRALPALLGA